MRLKLVVLPAPFGPISAIVSFSLTEKLTSCTARSPPNRLLRLRTTSASAIALSLHRLAADEALVGFRRDTDEPRRSPQDDCHQDQTVDRELHATRRAAEPTLQQCRCRLQQHRAYHRAPQGSDPADDRHQSRLDRDTEIERRRWVDEIDVLRVEGPGHRGEECADHVNVALDARRVHTDGFGGILILADGDEIITEP